MWAKRLVGAFFTNNYVCIYVINFSSQLYILTSFCIIVYSDQILVGSLYTVTSYHDIMKHLWFSEQRLGATKLSQENPDLKMKQPLFKSRSLDYFYKMN